jgi:xylan 1,4-beta-xylosidase
MKTESTGTVDFDTILKTGVREKPDANALTTRSAHDISAMVWNNHDDDGPGPAAPMRLTDANQVLVRLYRIDQEHSNAYTVWKPMGAAESGAAAVSRAGGGGSAATDQPGLRWMGVR